MASAMKMSQQKKQDLEKLHSLLQQHEGNLQAIDQVAAILYQHGFPLGRVLASYRKYLDRSPTSATATASRMS